MSFGAGEDVILLITPAKRFVREMRVVKKRGMVDELETSNLVKHYGRSRAL